MFSYNVMKWIWGVLRQCVLCEVDELVAGAPTTQEFLRQLLEGGVVV